VNVLVQKPGCDHKRRMTFYIYVIAPSAGFPCKVGVASNVGKRLKGIQVGNGEELHVHSVFAASNRGTAFRVEKFAHRRLQDNRMAGEWFNVFADDAVAVLQELCDEMGYGNKANILKNCADPARWV
jgi:hypothetical protein